MKYIVKVAGGGWSDFYLDNEGVLWAEPVMAADYDTREAAEEAALVAISKDPTLLGKTEVVQVGG